MPLAEHDQDPQHDDHVKIFNFITVGPRHPNVRREVPKAQLEQRVRLDEPQSWTELTPNEAFHQRRSR